MIAIDTSTLVAFLAGAEGADVDAMDGALADNAVVLPPVVVAEILSAPKAEEIETWIVSLPMLSVLEGFWVRAAAVRRDLHQRGLRSLLVDTLIFQSCADHDVALVTRDRDFRHFARHCGLSLVVDVD